MAGNGLTVKQEAFATAYIETGNASEAYRRSYDASTMNENSIGKTAHELLKHPKVAARIEELRAELRERHKVTVNRVVEELALLAFVDPGDFYEWDATGVSLVPKKNLTPEQRRCIAELSQTVTDAGGTLRLKLHSKPDALEKLGRHLGMFKDVHEHTGPDGGPIITRIERVIVDPPNPDGEGIPTPAGEPHLQGSKGGTG